MNFVKLKYKKLQYFYYLLLCLACVSGKYTSREMNDGLYHCECIGENDPCLQDDSCEIENYCPELDNMLKGIIISF